MANGYWDSHIFTMKILFLFIAAIALLSCDRDSFGYDEIEVQIINFTDFKVDLVKFYAADISDYACDSLSFENIEPNTEKTVLWSDVETCKTDGQFMIKAFLKDTAIACYGGYYANGILLDDKTTIAIYQDPLKITTVR